MTRFFLYNKVCLKLWISRMVYIRDVSSPNLLLNYVSVSLIAAKDDRLHGNTEKQEP